MKYKFLILILTLTSLNTFGQNSDRTYIGHDHNYSSTYSYGVTEITIHLDSSYTWKSWNVSNKKQWKTYKEYEPKISKGKITWNGEYYIFTEYRNGNKTDFYWIAKLNDKRLKFYYPNENKKMRISAKYKRN